MDKVEVTHAGRPLQIRSGHTPVNIGLVIGSLIAAVAAGVTTATRSAVVSQVLPSWASWAFYVVLFVSSAVVLRAIWRPLPHELTEETYHDIVSRLAWERTGLYGIAGIMLCFSVSAVANAWSGITAASWLTGIAIGLLVRARQTQVDADKLHEVVRYGITVSNDLVADPDEDS